MSSVTQTIKPFPNSILEYTRHVFKEETARVDGQLITDFQAVMQGHCVYLRKFMCAKNDFSILQTLMEDLKRKAAEDKEHGGMINWSRHFKYENPDFSPTFQAVLKRLEDYFDVEIHATRLNFYPDASSWKPFHHDSHAYGEKGVREDFTMGASFGCSRELVFLHPSSGAMFSFPQENGDVFAFDSEVNRKFQHGVPRLRDPKIIEGPRFSIIAWGRRRTLNERNGGPLGQPPVPNPAPVLRRSASTESAPEEKSEDSSASVGAIVQRKNYFAYTDTQSSSGSASGAASGADVSAGASPSSATVVAGTPPRKNQKGPEIDEVAEMVNRFIEAMRLEEEKNQRPAAGAGVAGGRGGGVAPMRGRGVVQRGGGRGGLVRGGAATGLASRGGYGGYSASHE